MAYYQKLLNGLTSLSCSLFGNEDSYFCLLLLHPENPRCNLDGGQRLGEVTRRGGDVGDHGGAAVHVAQRLAQQHGQLAVSAAHKSSIVLLKPANYQAGKQFTPIYE